MNPVLYLREPERDRVRDTLNVLNNHDYVPTAVIAAGSSIDTEAYPDIDLFLLIKEPFSPYKQGQARPNPKEEFRRKIEADLPEYVYFTVYGETDLSGELHAEELIQTGLGVHVTISLFYGLENFRERRPDYPDDLLEPPGPMGAEDIIAYNRAHDSKFLVLSRQYAI